MWIPDPIYKALPYIYFIIGILVGINLKTSLFSVVSMAALFIGGSMVLLMRHAAKKEEAARCAKLKRKH